MADNIVANAGSGGATFASDDIGGVHYPRSKVVWGADGTANDADVASGKALPIQLRTSGGTEIGTSGSPVRTDPTGTTTQPVSGTVTANAGTGPFPVSDNSGSLTVDAPAATPVAVRPSDGSTAQTYDQQDYDSGAGTVSRIGVGIIVPASGGPAVITGDVTNGLDVDVTRVQGNVTVVQTTPASLKGQFQLTDGTEIAYVNASNQLEVSVENTPTVNIGTFPDNEPVNISQWGGSAVGAGNPVRVDPTGTTTQPVSGTVTANAGTGPFPVSDNSGSLTVDAPTATPVPVAVTTTGDALVKPGDSGNNAIRVNIVAGGGSGGTSMTDDAAFTPGSTAITPAGGTYRSTRDTLDDNDAGAIALTQRRAVLTCVETPAGDSAMDETNDAVRVNIVAGGGSGGTAMSDDAAFTPGTTSITPVGGTYRSTRDQVDDNDAGAFAMTSRRAILGCLETPNGDSAMDDTNDAVKVNIVAGGGSGGTAQADKSTFTEGTTSLTPIGGVYNETPAGDPTEDQAAAARITAKRAIHSNLRDASGNEIASATSQPSGSERGIIVREAQKGQTTMANSRPVVIASDQSTLQVQSASANLATESTLSTLSGKITTCDTTSVTIGAAIPAGANKIGSVDLDSDTGLGVAPPTTAQYVAGTDGTNARALKTDANGELQVDVLSVAAGDNAIGRVKITDGTDVASINGSGHVEVSVQNSPTVDTELPAAAALADAASNPTTPIVGAGLLQFNGTTWDRARGDTTNGIDVDVTRVQGSVTVAQSTASNLKAEVVGPAATGAAVSGNPVLAGTRATTSELTKVDDGDVVPVATDATGRVIVSLASAYDLQSSAKVALTTDTATPLVTADASYRIAVMSVLVTNAHATVSTKVKLQDGASDKLIGQAQKEGGGFAFSGGGVPLFIGTLNTALNAQCVTTGADVDVFVTIAKIK